MNTIKKLELLQAGNAILINDSDEQTLNRVLRLITSTSDLCIDYNRTPKEEAKHYWYSDEPQRLMCIDRRMDFVREGKHKFNVSEILGNLKAKRIEDMGDKDLILCATEEESEAILKLMHESGLVWVSGIPYTEPQEKFRKGLCYIPSRGYWTNVMYSEKSDIIHNAKDIIAMYDYDKVKFEKTDIKNEDDFKKILDDWGSILEEHYGKKLIVLEKTPGLIKIMNLLRNKGE